jgi:hypothetical protein
MAVSFATTTTNLELRFYEPVNLDCTVHTIGGRTANIYVNSTTSQGSLGASLIYKLPILQDVTYFRINSTGNVTSICSYSTSSTSTIIVISPTSSTSTLALPENFQHIPGLVYVIGGLVLFICAIIFIDFLRRAIR